MYSKFLFALLALLGTAAVWASECVNMTDGFASMEPGVIALQADDQRLIELEVLVADSGFERASGFQHICPDVIDSTLILFQYSAAIPGRFHMENVHAPLDIAFFDASGRVIDVQRMETYTAHARPLYGPDSPFQYALEAPAGFFTQLGLSPSGGRLVIDGN